MKNVYGIQMAIDMHLTLSQKKYQKLFRTVRFHQKNDNIMYTSDTPNSEYSLFTRRCSFK